MGSQVWSLLSLGVGLNLVLGGLTAAFKLPIYLDSVGTVLVAALAGPCAGALAGAGGILLLGLTSPTAFAFLPVGVAVGTLTGLGARIGVFKKAWSSVVAGSFLGCCTAALAAPILTYLFGGVSGGGTDLLVAAFRASGYSVISAAFYQGLWVDPLDKALSFLVVFGLLRALPKRALTAFALADKLPNPPPLQDSDYRPQARPDPAQAPSTQRPADRSHSERVPQQAQTAARAAGVGWKATALLTTLGGLVVVDRPAHLSLWLAILLLAQGLVAPRLTWRNGRNALLVLAPLGLSLIVIHGLIGNPGDATTPGLGLSWSLPGLRLAWLFWTRVALVLLATSFFLTTTPLQQLADFLVKFRVPYPLLFVLLTGANLADQLRDRWRTVSEAQQARGLSLEQPGWGARFRTVNDLLIPTLGAFFSDLPTRAANLESRGFLRARRRHAIPSSWSREPAATPLGVAFHLAMIALALSMALSA